MSAPAHFTILLLGDPEPTPPIIGVEPPASIVIAVIFPIKLSAPDVMMHRLAIDLFNFCKQGGGSVQKNSQKLVIVKNDPLFAPMRRWNVQQHPVKTAREAPNSTTYPSLSSSLSSSSQHSSHSAKSSSETQYSSSFSS